MNPGDPFHALLEAIAFAGRAHRNQLRKDNKTPYFSHVVRVAFIARHVFGIDDERVLIAAVLHDTIEDTTTDFDEIEEHFGSEIAGWVALLSKDKRLPDLEREVAYQEGLAKAPWQVKICKLADIFDNLIDSAHLNPEQRMKTNKRALSYLKALRTEDLPDMVQSAWSKVEKQASASLG
jgi:guanosine-3',5'-bis(diphosphate) 3'-pyrophosphohydrolase